MLTNVTQMLEPNVYCTMDVNVMSVNLTFRKFMET
ncbi:Uncharacterised protein [Vibrio cholerae]|nr:Uncharacterised protein [Vibrio cholerae]